MLSMRLSISLRIANSPSHSRIAEAKGTSRVNINLIHRLRMIRSVHVRKNSLRHLSGTYIPHICPSIATSSNRFARAGSTRFNKTPCKCSLISMILPLRGFEARSVYPARLRHPQAYLCFLISALCQASLYRLPAPFIPMSRMLHQRRKNVPNIVLQEPSIQHHKHCIFHLRTRW
jgi:hypothetical protein